MFLKRIIIEGFKSFAQKTVIDFDDSLLGFVGPNGSGKSNINDAIKWTLGEKSLKQIRGKKSDDVIFKGSPKYKPSKFAEVTLIFDNTEKILDIKYTEVSITRRITKDSPDNEYFINKNKVRLKDVRNLILDTGLGNSKLSIISQGTISKIAEAKPLEIRSFLNEAAGVSKYQNKKNETIKKLEKVQQNLEVVEVIYQELEKQVKPLKKQSKNAKLYLEYKKELESIELSLISTNLKKEKDELKIISEELEKTTLKKDLTNTQLNVINSKIETKEKKIVEYETEINKLTKEKDSWQNRLNHLNNEKTELKQEDSLIRDYSEIKSTIKKNQESLSLKIKEDKKYDKDIKSLDDSQKEKDSKLAFYNKRLNDLIYLNKKLSLEEEHSKINSTDQVLNLLLNNKNMFPGIIGTINNFIDLKNKKDIWISFLLKNKLNKLIVDSKTTTLNIFKYLKENNKGNIDIISQKNYRKSLVLEKDLTVLKNLDGFKDCLSNYIKIHKNQLSDIIKNYVSNIFVFENYIQASKASSLVNSRVNIISLDGYYIHANHVIYSGSDIDIQFSNKQEIQKNNEKIKKLSLEINEYEKVRDNSSLELEKKIRNQLFLKQEIISIENQIKTWNLNASNIEDKYMKAFGKTINKNIKLSDVKNKTWIINQIEDISKKIFFYSSNKLEDIKSIGKIRIEKEKINKDLIKSINLENKQNIAYEKLDSIIENQLDILNNDYKLTYEMLKKKNYKLKITVEEAKIQVAKIKSKIEKLGYINFDSIENFKLIEDRFNKISLNYNDTKNSRKELLKVISELDKQMVKKVEITFEKVKKEFNKIFIDIFNGDSADLRFTDKNNILESGIDILVKQKNKSITNLSLFSGGEKSMISLAFVFSIINVKKMPFLIMDEAEAALDENNVERYARFCDELNKKTQVMVVTHRPRTMELCGTLYGVTMEGNSGVTKIVSVKLQDAKNFVK